MDPRSKNEEARANFMKLSTPDAAHNSVKQFDEKITRIRRNSEALTESSVERFRPRANSIGHSVTGNQSTAKSLIPKPTNLNGGNSAESLFSKSPPRFKPKFDQDKIKMNAGSKLKPTSPLPVIKAGNVIRPNTDPQTTGGIQSNEYEMNHKYKGKVVIFNHKKFKNDEITEREGTDVDVKRLKDILVKLGFRKSDIDVCNDYTLSKIDNKLEKLSQEDHKDNDLLMLFVLSHGEKDDRIHAYDHDYSVSKLWKPFTAEKCKSLAGKPKIFFIVACRGDQTDSGARIPVNPNRRKLSLNTETDAVISAPNISYTIPVWADFLTVYSTYQGYYSYRDSDDGTWYIQTLCKEIESWEENRIHFMDLLTKVNRTIAIGKETFNLDNPLIHKKKQCPFISSTLTRTIYLDKR